MIRFCLFQVFFIHSNYDPHGNLACQTMNVMCRHRIIYVDMDRADPDLNPANSTLAAMPIQLVRIIS